MRDKFFRVKPCSAFGLWPKRFATGMLTRALFAVANLLVDIERLRSRHTVLMEGVEGVQGRMS